MEAYAELETEPGAPEAVIRQARNILLRVWHPDRHQQDAKLLNAANNKTSAVNAAFDLIEKAGFPSPAEIADLDPKLSVDQLLKVRELHIREREVAVKERLAEKPSTTDWIDDKARSLFRLVVILGCIVGMVAISGFAVLLVISGSNNSDSNFVKVAAVFVDIILFWILAAFWKKKPR